MCPIGCHMLINNQISLILTTLWPSLNPNFLGFSCFSKSLLLILFPKMASLIVAAILMAIFSTSSARDFTIGWVENPKESLNAWSSRMRFLVSDKLVFKQDEAKDSVLVVKKEDYDSCSVKNPIQKIEGGDSSTFQLTRSGPFYFISSDEEKCSKGEKMIVVVISVKNKQPMPSTSPSSSSMAPSASPSSSSPSASSMAPSVSPSSSSMTPGVSSKVPSVSPSSSSMAPGVSSMAPSVSPSPSSMAPGVSSMTPSASPSSMAPAVSSPPSSSSLMAPINSPTSSSSTMAPSSGNGGVGSGRGASPAPTQNAKSSATALAASSVVTTVMGIAALSYAILGLNLLSSWV